MSNHKETIIYNNEINSAIDEGVISSTDRTIEQEVEFIFQDIWTERARFYSQFQVENVC